MLTYETSLGELEQYLDKQFAGNARARTAMPQWFEMQTGQYLAIGFSLVLVCSMGWVLAWAFHLPATMIALLCAPTLYAFAEHVLPRRFRLGNTPIEFTVKHVVCLFVFCKMHVAVKIVTLVLLTLVSGIVLAVYYPVVRKSRGEDNTLLHVALYQQCDIELVRALVLRGADVNAVNSNCDTPLHFAATHSLEAVELLMQHGALVNTENYNKRIALDLAKRPAIAECLLKHGSRMNPNWKTLQVAGFSDLLQIPTNLGKKLLKRGETLCFLSHHKQDAAGVAIYLHDMLQQRFHLEPHQVFLDSNELGNITDLAQLVTETKVLVLVQTKDVMTRPFCLVELYTALQNKIPIVCVVIEGSGYDFEANRAMLQHQSDFCATLKLRNPGAVHILELAGYDVNAMAQTVGSIVPNIISKPFNPSASARVRASQIDDVCSAVVSALS